MKRLHPWTTLGIAWTALFLLAVVCFSAQESPAPEAAPPIPRAAIVVPTPATPPRSFPLPPEHAFARIVEIRIKDGDSLRCRRLLDGGLSQELDIRLAPTDGTFNASDRDRSPAKARLEALLTGGPFWVQLTGDRSFERWVGRVYRQVTVEVPMAGGIGFEPRLENVADRMRYEGFDVPRGE